MAVLDVINKLRESSEYKQWVEKNPAAKLVHVFLMLDPGNDPKYDIGFFDHEKKLMTSFLVDLEVNDMEINTSDEVFAKDISTIKPLEEGRIKVDFSDACAKCKALQKEKYAQHEPIKEVVILQNLEQGQVWNITYITKTFRTLNMKLDAETGKIIEDSLQQIFNFDK